MLYGPPWGTDAMGLTAAGAVGDLLGISMPKGASAPQGGDLSL
ncbi:hypothetical protein BQ8482_180026 [Mesorhizobium delmotii]|uniref:Uncharacterized protein n=1 Tax=Mesorhizobium delmotii TaxID=1631247 RepID=A0A2P9AI62_9HYPH|nr:hypothetical protein BQ8482_180026 [Mesorhizobium delmotii]